MRLRKKGSRKAPGSTNHVSQVGSAPAVVEGGGRGHSCSPYFPSLAAEDDKPVAAEEVQSDSGHVK